MYTHIVKSPYIMLIIDYTYVKTYVQLKWSKFYMHVWIK
jgi:hypothetical protein